MPLINGSDTNFSHPFVLTYPQCGYPTDKPRAELTDQQPDRFRGAGNGGVLPVLGTISSNQLWGADSRSQRPEHSVRNS